VAPLLLVFAVDLRGRPRGLVRQLPREGVGRSPPRLSALVVGLECLEVIAYSATRGTHGR
jgi:hypothetical protein